MTPHLCPRCGRAVVLRTVLAADPDGTPRTVLRWHPVGARQHLSCPALPGRYCGAQGTDPATVAESPNESENR